MHLRSPSLLAVVSHLFIGLVTIIIALLLAQSPSETPLTKHHPVPASQSVSPTSFAAMASTKFPAPIHHFDIHVYYWQGNPESVSKAQALHHRIKQEFPDMTAYPMVSRPVGPHVTAMFEVKILNPEQFGRIVPWLAIHRDNLSVLVHPHTGDEIKDHKVHPIWMGERLPVDLNLLRQYISAQR